MGRWLTTCLKIAIPISRLFLNNPQGIRLERCGGASGTFQFSENAFHMRTDRTGTHAQSKGHLLVTFSQADPSQYLSFSISQNSGSLRGRLQLLTICRRQDSINNERVEAPVQSLVTQERSGVIFAEGPAPWPRRTQCCPSYGCCQRTLRNGDRFVSNTAKIAGAILPLIGVRG
jgi:hypothetical protein